MMVSGGFVMVRFQMRWVREIIVQIYVLRYKWILDVFQVNFFLPSMLFVVFIILEIFDTTFDIYEFRRKNFQSIQRPVNKAFRE